MQLQKRYATLFLTLLLLCFMSITAYAHEALDESRKGTITVKMEYDGRTITGGTFTAYRVGQIQKDNGSYSFVKTSDMEAFPGGYDDIGSAKLAEDAAAFLKEHSVRAYATAENKGGTAVFTDLETGLYLIVQTEASDGYKPLKPFLVTVPMNENGKYVYEVNAAGKFQPQPDNPDKPDKPTTPQKPSEPTLPQTGQLNWPVPVLAALGLMVFSAGWVLRFWKKKDGYEK